MMTTDQRSKDFQVPTRKSRPSTSGATPLTYASVLLSKPTRLPTLLPQGNNTVSNTGIKAPEKRATSAASLSRRSSDPKSASVVAEQATKLSSVVNRRNRNRSHSSLLIQTGQQPRGIKVSNGKVSSKSSPRGSVTQMDGGKSDSTICTPKPTEPKQSRVSESTKSGKKSKRRRSKKRGTIGLVRHSSLVTLETSNVSAASVKRSNQRLFSLSDFLTSSTPKRQENPRNVANRKLQPIDETKCQKVGKVREFPKPKRPSRLKQVILSERSIRRCTSVPGDMKLAQTFITDTNSSEAIILAETQRQVTKAIQIVEQSVLSVEQENKIALFIGKLADFQDRAYTKYAHVPFHRKRTKRFVCGLREVVKHLQLKHVCLIFLARDLERNATDRCYQLKNPSVVTNDVNSPDSECHSALPILESILQQIWTLATNMEPVTPIIISQSRRRLAKLCHKPGRVSVVGILSAAGAEDLSKEILSMNIAVNISSEGKVS